MLLFTSNSGDQDSKIPLTQTRIIANNLAKDLSLVPFTKYGTWYDKQQVYMHKILSILDSFQSSVWQMGKWIKAH
jgi:hypothetical protein